MAVFISRVLKFCGKRVFTWLLVGAVSGVFLSFVEFALSIYIQYLLIALGYIDKELQPVYIPFFDGSSNTALLACLVVIGLSRSIAVFYSTQSALIASELISTRLRMLASYAILKGNDKSLVSSADINFRMNEVFPKASCFLDGVARTVPSGLSIFIMGIGLIYYSPIEACLGFVGVVIVGYLVNFFNKKVLAYSNLLFTEQANMSKAIERVIKNWLLVRILRKSDEELNSLTHSVVAYSSSRIRAGLYNNLALGVPSFLGIILLAIIVGTHLAFWKETKNVQFISFLYLFIRFSQSLAQFAGDFSKIVSCYVQFKEALNYFDRFSSKERLEAFKLFTSMSASGRIDKPMIHGNMPLSSASELQSITAPQCPSISIQNLSFSYGDKLSPIFQKINIEVKPGEQLGLMGPSGSGKSTLLSLILGIIDPSEGQIFIDGKSPKAYFGRFQNSVGYVGAEPFIIAGTVRENLLYGGLGQFSDEDLWESLELAKLYEISKTGPKGLDFYLNEHADGLSAGQKQRLSLARALLPRPTLLILDEVSANLDVKTEEEIAASIKLLKGKTTVIIVSHRKDMLIFADRILSLS